MKNQLSLQTDNTSALAPSTGKIKQNKSKSVAGQKFQDLLLRVDGKEGLKARQTKSPPRNGLERESLPRAAVEQLTSVQQDTVPVQADDAGQEFATSELIEERDASNSPPATTDLMFLSLVAAHNMHKAFAAPLEQGSKAVAEPEPGREGEPDASEPDLGAQTASISRRPSRQEEAAEIVVTPPDASENKEAQPTSTFTIPMVVKSAPESQTARREITLTLTKVETVLLPAAPVPIASAPLEHAELAQATTALPSSPVVPDPSPGAAVVRTIHFHLQPEHLGELKVSMHLKGEDLRVTVEVTTREAHAALQRDTSYLREVLEKAGYDLAEQSVAVNLRLEPALAQQPTTGGDGFSFTRSNSGEQSFHAAAHGQQQQRQPSRQVDKEQGDAQANRNVQSASAAHTASGIYI